MLTMRSKNIWATDNFTVICLSQDRQAGCSYFIKKVFCWLYFCSDYPQDKNKSQNESLFHFWAFWFSHEASNHYTTTYFHSTE